MEWRVARLEEDSRELRKELRGLVDAVARSREDVLAKVSLVERDLSELKGRVANLPTTWAMLTGMTAVMLGLAALVFGIARALGRG